MNKEILIQSNEDQTQVAVLEDDQLVEIYIERAVSTRLVGSIYKGRVENVLPGMQAAFVNIGIDKNAFLYVEEALPHGYGAENNGNKPNIRDLLKEGQEILVQVSKEPLGTKGPRVTRQITLPGRFIVLMPNSDYIGISRRINSPEERERLKKIGEDIKPEKMGIILRTVATGVSMEEIKEDLENILSLWKKILNKSSQVKAPFLVHKDLELVKRILRDVVTEDVNRIIVNSRVTHEKIMDIVEPRALQYKINLSDDSDLFSKYNIHQELTRALKRKVWLKSGGYIVIDQTEALVSIDVNTGKYIGSTNLEDTVFKTNMEAAVEIARQLRLRNIGGIIIVDFIDMDTPEHKEEIIAKLEEQFQRDKVKTHILGLTSLGLLEMTRKKMRHTLSTVLEKTCPCCEGKGTILSETTLAFRIKEELQETAQRTMAETILLKVNPKVAALLVGPGGMLLKQLESNLKKEIIIQGKEKLAIDEYTLEPLHGNVDPRYGIPVEEEQLIRITVTEPHGQRSQDGIGRIAGFVIEIEDGASLVGKEILVEITKVFRTYAKAVIVKDYLE
ncbi:MAG: Rne/Rng family ribonuclease [Clostridia bacterium]|jgi:ribonuclease G|nr:Rne/Rng family ribonuclease [Clostridia bacterium]